MGSLLFDIGGLSLTCSSWTGRENAGLISTVAGSMHDRKILLSRQSVRAESCMVNQELGDDLTDHRVIH